MNPEQQTEHQTEPLPRERGAGRKPKDESRADELRQRLIEWEWTPQAIELEVSHQMLSYYRVNLEEWWREKKLEHIRAVAKAKDVPATRELETRYLAWIKNIEKDQVRNRPRLDKLAPMIAAARKHLEHMIANLPANRLKK